MLSFGERGKIAEIVVISSLVVQLKSVVNWKVSASKSVTFHTYTVVIKQIDEQNINNIINSTNSKHFFSKLCLGIWRRSMD